jgi:hypothetical protein
MAEVWDSHDLTDFDDDLEEVVEPVFEHRPENIKQAPTSPNEESFRK